MVNLKTIIRATLFFALSFFAAHAQEADSSLVASQKTLLNSLDSLEKNSLGFALNGKAKGGVSAFIMDIKDLSNEGKQTEYLSYTDFLLSISIKPSNETRALFDMRFHKDWQSAYREGNNQPVISWWSYDGLILSKTLKFNLGTMRVGYTPLTMATPGIDFIFEPKIFADMREEAMADRYLDDSGKRLLQGLNAEFNTPLGFVDNLNLKATIARLRNSAKKMDQVFFDFDPIHDRYATAAGLGLEAFGLRIGVNDVYAFDRIRSTRVKSTMAVNDSIPYEKNNVLSFEGGVNSKKWFSGAISFGANAEFAISKWLYFRDYKKSVQDTIIYLEMINPPSPSFPCRQCPSEIQGNVRYPSYSIKENFRYELTGVEEARNKTALLADAFIDYNAEPLYAKLSGHYLKTNRDFESELAASPAYLPIMPILNSNAAFEPSGSAQLDAMFGQFRSGSLENLYYSLYYTLPLNAATMIAGYDGEPIASTQDQLFNNYKLGQYYRNSYTYRAYTHLERRNMDDYLELDPSVNMALPYGYATPDRKGGDADISINWNDAVLVRGVFGKYSSELNKYTRFGGGLSVKIARLANLQKQADISGSFEQNKEKDGLEREATRIMGGFDIGVWRGLSLLAGIQLLDKKFGIPYGGIVEKTSEMLVLGGPSIKMSERAFFVVQGGLLSNSVNALGGEKLDIDKYIASGNVRVAF